MVPVDERIQVEPFPVNALLRKAMAGGLTSEAFVQELLSCDLYSKFSNKSPDYIEPSWTAIAVDRPPKPEPYVGRGFRTSGNLPRRTPRLNEDPAWSDENKAIGTLFQAEKQKWLESCLGPWLVTNLAHRDALRDGAYIDEFRTADGDLKFTAKLHGWAKLTEWVARVNTMFDALGPIVLTPLLYRFKEQYTQSTFYAEAQESIDILRERVRLLLILCEGVERSPLRVLSGEQQPRKTTRHIMHSGQTHADALAELAGRLVYPPQRYVAHVRQPQQYHQVKLRPPLAGGEGAGPRVPHPNQPDDIRTRSRALYDTSTNEAAVVPPSLVEPEQPQPRRVTRYPRPQDPEEER
jgi:hypothetical protein